MRLAGKVAVVTGGGSGIGRGIVLAMAREGADIAIPDIQVLNAEKVADEVKALGRKAIAMKTDVTSSADVRAMVERTREFLGKVDILVNNAGMAAPPGMPFTNNTEEDWDRAFAVNTKSVFLTCKAVAPYFIERKAGRIVNIASIAGPLSAPTMPAYSVAKQGVITFTRVVAKELAPHGITANAICPGVLYTEFWQKLAQHIADTNPAFKGMTARQVFDKRVGDIVPMKVEQQPEDIGNAAVFLASDEARYITGQALMVDGGCVMYSTLAVGLAVESVVGLDRPSHRATRRRREREFRKEVRAWLEQNLPDDLRGKAFAASRADVDEVRRLRAWQKTMAEAGYVGMDWPREFGGRGAPITEMVILYQEMARAESPQIVNRGGVSMLGPTLMKLGTPEQQKRFLPRIRTAEDLWCQGFSEPNAGSDLANLQTRAVLDGDHFVVNGQKVWTSMGHVADWCFLLVRTDPAAAKHKGISFLLVDMKTPGITVRPLRQITGEAEFNETFFDNVRVPKENLVGKINEGWSVAITTLAYERDLLTFIRHISLRNALHRLVKLTAGPRPQHRSRRAAEDRRAVDRRAGAAAERLSQPHQDPARRSARTRGLDVQAVLEPARPGAGAGRDAGDRALLADRGGLGVGARRRPVAVLRAAGARQRHPRRHHRDSQNILGERVLGLPKD